MNPSERSPRSGDAIWRQSTPETIEADLANLWKDTAKDGPISRAFMSNLVVVSPRRLFPSIEDVTRQHPARTIFLGYTVGAENACAPEAARVGLLTFGEGSSRYGVELIAVRAVCADESIASIVRALIHGAVPTTVWWTGDLSNPVPPSAITTMGRQLVYNSELWQNVKEGVAAALSLLDRPNAPDLADLNWRRIAPIRSALLHVLRGEPSRDFQTTTVKITHRVGEGAAGWLVAGWLSAGMKTDAVRVQEGRQGDEILSVTISDGEWSVFASMNPQRVHVSSTGRPPFVQPVPLKTEGEAVAAELRSLGHDLGLRAAIRATAVRLAA